MQRRTPSLFRLRTGVRIPPPPAFARVTTTSELQLGRRAGLELCESCPAVAAVGREGGLPARFSCWLGQASLAKMRAITRSLCSDQPWILLTPSRVQDHLSSLRS